MAIEDPLVNELAKDLFQLMQLASLEQWQDCLNAVERIEETLLKLKHSQFISKKPAEQDN